MTRRAEFQKAIRLSRHAQTDTVRAGCELQPQASRDIYCRRAAAAELMITPGYIALHCTASR